MRRLGWRFQRQGVKRTIGRQITEQQCAVSVGDVRRSLSTHTNAKTFYEENMHGIFFNPLRPSGIFTYHQVKHSQILFKLLPLLLCVLGGSQNKQLLLPYTAITDWFCVAEVESVYSAVRTESLCVLCVSENKQRLFPYTALTDWFCIAEWRVFTARYGLGI